MQYEGSDYKGKTTTETQNIASFLYDEILHTESYRSSSKERIHLEEQPRKVIEAMGRMVEILLDKGILNLEDLKTIADCGWGRKADSLKLKPEVKEE